MRCKHGCMLILAGVMLGPVPGRAERAWDYARDREKALTGQLQPAETRPVRPEPGPAAGPSAPAAVKKPARKVEKAKGSPARPRNAVTPAPDGLAETPGSAVSVPPVIADPATAGRWLRRLIDAAQLIPGERTRRAALRSLNEKYQAAVADIERLKLRDGQRQALFEKLQRRLREEQRPALPESPRLREDFAEGMATGRDVEALLTRRRALGLETDRAAFLAGLRETMRGDSRVSEEEFQRLLTAARARLAQAEEQEDRRRQEADKKWLAEFRRQPDVLQSRDAVLYRKMYNGDRQVGDDEVLTVGIVRRLTEGAVLEDSDISGRVLSAKLKDYPPLLRSILGDIGLHGEVLVAMPVNRDGIPDTAGPWTESWTLRSMEVTD
ncbi:hypothetical protein A6J71_00140 [Enterobacter cancerogenus]|nr:hypothetical protein A6J71_00140 [Enterobacter cancerogenus]